MPHHGFSRSRWGPRFACPTLHNLHSYTAQQGHTREHRTQPRNSPPPTPSQKSGIARSKAGKGHRLGTGSDRRKAAGDDLRRGDHHRSLGTRKAVVVHGALHAPYERLPVQILGQIDRDLPGLLVIEPAAVSAWRLGRCLFSLADVTSTGDRVDRNALG